MPGFALMLSVPKSASVPLGIGEADVRATIRQAQVEGVEQALGYLEDVACRGRLGAGGQGGSFTGRGLLAAAFEHRTSRAGDPQLHTHVFAPDPSQGAVWAERAFGSAAASSVETKLLPRPAPPES
jgi:conjugative relaxase-like TrwC/TraI family protein